KSERVRMRILFQVTLLILLLGFCYSHAEEVAGVENALSGQSLFSIPKFPRFKNPFKKPFKIPFKKPFKIPFKKPFKIPFKKPFKNPFPPTFPPPPPPPVFRKRHPPSVPKPTPHSANPPLDPPLPAHPWIRPCLKMFSRC
ncbi:hypothetical protein ACQCRO_27825, partial [Ralstonia pseudosolanacearum]